MTVTCLFDALLILDVDRSAGLVRTSGAEGTAGSQAKEEALGGEGESDTEKRIYEMVDLKNLDTHQDIWHNGTQKFWCWNEDQ